MGSNLPQTTEPDMVQAVLPFEVGEAPLYRAALGHESLIFGQGVDGAKLGGQFLVGRRDLNDRSDVVVVPHRAPWKRF